MWRLKKIGLEVGMWRLINYEKVSMWRLRKLGKDMYVEIEKIRKR